MYSKTNRMEQLQPELMTCLAGVMASATRHAATFSEHRNSHVVKPIDILAGLIYRLMTQADEQEMQAILEDGQTLLRPGTDTDEDDSDAAVDDSLDEPAELDIGILTYSCDCPKCTKLRRCIVHFNEFTPRDPLSACMHKAIKKTQKLHHLSVLGRH